MVIENVISNEDLEERFNSLCESNWKIKNMSQNLSGSAKDVIDNWYDASRSNLLKLLNIVENESYPFVYHDKQPTEDK
jgi:hypothetical protein